MPTADIFGEIEAQCDAVVRCSRISSRLFRNALMQLTINGTLRSFDRPVATVADLVRELGLEGKRIAVERNGTIVPRSRYGETAVAAGDRLEIVGAVGGG